MPVCAILTVVRIHKYIVPDLWTGVVDFKRFERWLMREQFEQNCIVLTMQFLGAFSFLIMNCVTNLKNIKWFLMSELLLHARSKWYPTINFENKKKSWNSGEKTIVTFSSFLTHDCHSTLQKKLKEKKYFKNPVTVCYTAPKRLKRDTPTANSLNSVSAVPFSWSIIFHICAP